MTWPDLAGDLTKLLPVGGLTTLVAFAWPYVKAGLQATAAFFRRLNRAMDKVDTMERKVDTMEKTLGPNGGKSLFDAIGRLELNAKRSDARAAAVTYCSADAIWEADEKGNFFAVNRAFEDLTNASVHDVLGRQWISMLHPVCRERVVRDWESAIADRRRFTTEAVISNGGMTRVVTLEAEPMRTVEGDVVGWLGRVYEA